MESYLDQFLLDWIALFYPPTVWEVLFSGLLPALAVLAAVLIGVSQYRQSESLKRRDRTSAAVAELAEMLIESAAFSTRIVSAVADNDLGAPNLTATERFLNEVHFARAKGLMPPEFAAVVHWAHLRAVDMYPFVKRQLASGVPMPESRFDNESPGGYKLVENGPLRASVMDQGAWAVDKLHGWLDGQVDYSWFIHQLELDAPPLQKES